MPHCHACPDYRITEWVIAETICRETIIYHWYETGFLVLYQLCERHYTINRHLACPVYIYIDTCPQDWYCYPRHQGPGTSDQGPKLSDIIASNYIHLHKSAHKLPPEQRCRTIDKNTSSIRTDLPYRDWIMYSLYLLTSIVFDRLWNAQRIVKLLWFTYHTWNTACAISVSSPSVLRRSRLSFRTAGNTRGRLDRPSNCCWTICPTKQTRPHTYTSV